jgi:hypothetical protein
MLILRLSKAILASIIFILISFILTMHLQSNAPSIRYLSNSVKTFPAKSSWPRKALRAVAPLTLAGKSSAACSAISLSEPRPSSCCKPAMTRVRATIFGHVKEPR